jgi:hypothetical protein
MMNHIGLKGPGDNVSSLDSKLSLGEVGFSLLLLGGLEGGLQMRNNQGSQSMLNPHIH